MHEKGNQFELNIFSALHAALYTHKSEWREKCIYVAGAQKSLSQGLLRNRELLFIERAILPTKPRHDYGVFHDFMIDAKIIKKKH
jgi:hypothetical protein